MESPIEMDDVGVSPFSEISMWVLIQGDHLLFNGYSEKTSRNISKHQPTCVICVSKASAWLATHPLGFALFGFNKVQSLKADGKVRKHLTNNTEQYVHFSIWVGNQQHCGCHPMASFKAAATQKESPIDLDQQNGIDFSVRLKPSLYAGSHLL